MVTGQWMCRREGKENGRRDGGRWESGWRERREGDVHYSSSLVTSRIHLVLLVRAARGFRCRDLHRRFERRRSVRLGVRMPYWRVLML